MFAACMCPKNIFYSTIYFFVFQCSWNRDRQSRAERSPRDAAEWRTNICRETVCHILCFILMYGTSGIFLAWPAFVAHLDAHPTCDRRSRV